MYQFARSSSEGCGSGYRAQQWCRTRAALIVPEGSIILVNDELGNCALCRESSSSMSALSCPWLILVAR